MVAVGGGREVCRMGGFKSWKVRAEALGMSQSLWPVLRMSFLCAEAFGAPLPWPPSLPFVPSP